jgi:hypothetical protein
LQHQAPELFGKNQEGNDLEIPAIPYFSESKMVEILYGSMQRSVIPAPKVFAVKALPTDAL